MLNFKKIRLSTAILLLILVIYLYNILPLPFVTSWGNSSNYENVSVRTTVNITQSLPEILNVTCNDGAAITLNAGTTKTIYCLVQIRDFNGGNTINNTNMTFYYYLNQSIDSDDKNEHYTNTSCSENNTDSYYTNWTCAISIWYYANNGTWQANATVQDNNTMNASAITNVSIYSLYALNVTDLINFGDMAVGDISATAQEANITNFGNMAINVSMYGFGGANETGGANLAMICEVRNISISDERYALNSTAAYSLMTSLPSASTTIPGLTLPQRTNDSEEVINATYWRLHVNESTNPYGECNGTVVFAAIAP